MRHIIWNARASRVKIRRVGAPSVGAWKVPAGAWGEERRIIAPVSPGVVALAGPWALDLRTGDVLTSEEWRCMTCAREGAGPTPKRCPFCASEHDERHGPHRTDG